MTETPFKTSSSSAGDEDRVRVQDYLGTLILIEKTDDPIDLSTDYGDTSATPARLLDCDNDADGWQETLVFPKAIQGEIKDGKPRLGVVAKVKSKKGFDMYVLTDPTPAQIKQATKVWQKNDLPF